MPGILKAFLIPGLPQLVFEDSGGGGWEKLRTTLRKAGQQALALQPDVIVLYSAQWISVLGHSLQYAARLTGIQVDETWHELGAIPYDFSIDQALTGRIEQLARQQGLTTKLVDFEGFPVDTATLVALKYFNPNHEIPVVIVSSNIYASREESMQLGQACGKAIQESGKRAILLNCSLLSSHFHQEEVRPETDRIFDPAEDHANRQMLSLLEQGDTRKVLGFAPEYALKVSADMGFKGHFWMMGALDNIHIPADILAYEPLYGTGAAVIAYPGSP